MTPAERLRRAVQRSQARYEKLQRRSRVNAGKLQGDDRKKYLEIPVSPGDAEFIFDWGIGTQDQEHVSGSARLARGPLSLISQLGPSLGNKFSYCLVSVLDSPTQTSPLVLGHSASFNDTGGGSTPILKGTSQNPPWYYLSLQGISVNDKLLAIPAGTFDLKSDGSGGFIIDPGTTLTYLPKLAYGTLKAALASSIIFPESETVPAGLDFCILPEDSANSTFPSVTFHFKGADYFLPIQNYFVAVNDGGRLFFCLGMLPNQKDSDVSILGNFQQQNYRILYDNDNNLLSFNLVQACDI